MILCLISKAQITFDKTTQKVNGLSIQTYRGLREKSLDCDSSILLKNLRIQEKDSIIVCQDSLISSYKREIIDKNTTNKDLESEVTKLNESKKYKLNLNPLTGSLGLVVFLVGYIIGSK